MATETGTFLPVTEVVAGDRIIPLGGRGEPFTVGAVIYEEPYDDTTADMTHLVLARVNRQGERIAGGQAFSWVSSESAPRVRVINR